MLRKLFLSFFLLMLGSLAVGAVSFVPPVPVNDAHSNPIGSFISYLHEGSGRLSLDEVIDVFEAGGFSSSYQPILNLGVGSRPVWLCLRVENTSTQALKQRLSLQTPWLDYVDFYVLHHGRLEKSYHLGDRKNFAERPLNTRYFAFDHDFTPEISEVFVRIETPDTMVLPIYLMPLDQAREQEKVQDFSYGFLYGFLLALMIYNIMLYFGLKDTRYILYSLYLGMFVLMNVSYTGYGFQWLWPQNTLWEQWSIPIFMTLFGASGLVFAMRFLEIGKHYPRLCKSIPYFLGAVALLMSLAIVFSAHYLALILAFGFVFLFIGLMMTLGAMTLRTEDVFSRYFLLATFFAMSGALITTLATWGAIPFNTWTFRAVEVGMMIDATLLALALTYKFRVGHEAMLRAEKMAMLDPLTGLDNRRAFYDKAIPIWNISERHRRDLSLIMLDLDHFKKINDAHGHACGDEVLAVSAKVLKTLGRKQDVVSRWGGEEFILLLPETNIVDAIQIAERLRVAIEGLRIRCENFDIKVTASFGIAQREAKHVSLDTLISTADHALYRAKDAGRNCIAHS